MPQPSDSELERIYSGEYFLGSTDSSFTQDVRRLKRLTAASYLDVIDQECGISLKSGTRLFEIGCGTGAFLLEAQGHGFDVQGSDISPTAVATANAQLGDMRVQCGRVLELALEPESTDVCAMSDVIEHDRDPGQLLEVVHRLVKPGGLVFISTPSLDSWSAKILGRHWVEYKPEHLYYFGTATLRMLLEQKGFANVHFLPGRKVLSLNYIAEHFVRFPLAGVTPLLKMARSALPRRILCAPFSIVASGLLALARRV